MCAYCSMNKQYMKKGTKMVKIIFGILLSCWLYVSVARWGKVWSMIKDKKAHLDSLKNGDKKNHTFTIRRTWHKRGWCVQGSLNKFPDFFPVGTFIDSTHMKLKSPSKKSLLAAMHLFYCSNNFWKAPWKSFCGSVSMTFITACFFSSIVS